MLPASGSALSTLPAYRLRRMRLVLLLAGTAAVAQPALALQTDIAGPPGSGRFGNAVKVLPNGNFVVTDPEFDVPGGATNAGAAYLFGPEGLLRSTLTGSQDGDRVGSQGVVALANGNYVVLSPEWRQSRGAVTWGSGSDGVAGAVSAANSLVSATQGSQGSGIGSGGVVALPNGHYVVQSPFWDDGERLDLGAATWGDGSTGTAGLVSAANSMVGSTPGDLVGANITLLHGSRFLVQSSVWDDPATGTVNVGAVTWSSGDAPRVGVIGPHDSLVGVSAYDNVGAGPTLVLQNGNYVVAATGWDGGPQLKDAGAVTWGDGQAGTTGRVSPANSLVGTSPGGFFGLPVALANGNYVAMASSWSDPVSGTRWAGLVAWGDGRGGTVGPVSAVNALVGGSPDDHVGSGGVYPLDNGDYVVSSPGWNGDDGTITSAGAATWGDGRSGVRGVVSSSNSTVGAQPEDFVSSGPIAVLPNGRYAILSGVLDSPQGARNVGAVTWMRGGGPGVGTVSATNSLVGTQQDDLIGSDGITVLANGNFVVASPLWNARRGAATWVDGRSGIAGPVSPRNSLVGLHPGDAVGRELLPLDNGHFVVGSPAWQDPRLANAPVGAVTWGNGQFGSAGTVDAGNSLVGSTPGDSVGFALVGLPGGRYLAANPFWDAPGAGAWDVGAVTWLDGSGPAVGVPHHRNSLIGIRNDERLGYGNIAAQADGSYVVASPYRGFNPIFPAYPRIGTVTLASPTGLSGPLQANSTVTGTSTFGVPLPHDYDAQRRQLIVGRPEDNIVTLLAAPGDALFGSGFE